MLDLLRQTSVPIESIRIDGGTQSRVRIDPETVADYADAMQGGAEFPPVIVYYDGNQYWLADGFHRLQAWVSAWPERTGIPAEVRQGDRREAVLHSVGANDAHGLRRTNEDKRRAVLRLLEDAEWGAWSDREIARRCNVSDKTVGQIRKTLTADFRSDTQPVERTYTTKHGTTATMQTGNIGKGQAIPKTGNPSPAMSQNGTAPTPAQGRPMLEVIRTEEEADADERGRAADAAVAMVQAEVDASEWPRLQWWHRALAVAFSDLTQAAPIAESYGFGVETERLLAELRALRDEVKRLTPGDRLR